MTMASTIAGADEEYCSISITASDGSSLIDRESQIGPCYVTTLTFSTFLQSENKCSTSYMIRIFLGKNITERQTLLHAI
jgi:hypothetical protein